METLKDIIDYLKIYYNYVRLMELYHELILEHQYIKFKSFLLCSNTLEEYDSQKIEIQKIKAEIKSSKVNLMFFNNIKLLNGKNIPIFVML